MKPQAPERDRLCVTCKHHRPDPNDLAEYAKCVAPQNMAAPQVDGCGFPRIKFCTTHREDRQSWLTRVALWGIGLGPYCGADGRWWEPKS